MYVTKLYTNHHFLQLPLALWVCECLCWQRHFREHRLWRALWRVMFIYSHFDSKVSIAVGELVSTEPRNWLNSRPQPLNQCSASHWAWDLQGLLESCESSQANQCAHLCVLRPLTIARSSQAHQLALYVFCLNIAIIKEIFFNLFSRSHIRSRECVSVFTTLPVFKVLCMDSDHTLAVVRIVHNFKHCALAANDIYQQKLNNR